MADGSYHGRSSDVIRLDFDAVIRLMKDRKKGNAARAIRCLLVPFSPGMVAFVPRPHPQLLPIVRAVVSAVYNAANRALDLPAR